MRVVSFNIHRAVGVGNRRPSIRAIGAVLRELAPDVVALNEILRTPLLADQPARLASMLHMSQVFGRTITSWGMPFGNAVLSRGRILDAERVLLPGEGAEPRCVLFVDTEVDGARFTFASTHLEVRGAPRAAQLEALPAMLKAVRGSELGLGGVGPGGHASGGSEGGYDGSALVLAGDFNAQGAELHLLAEGAGLSLAPEQATFPSAEPTIAIDHVLYSDHWRALDAFVLARPVSDHAALVVDLERVH